MNMAFLSQLRGLGASAVALAVATGAGVAFALPGSSSELMTAVPAASPAISEEDARELAINSRNAQRKALTMEVTDEAQQRSAELEQTTKAIDQTENKLQAKHAAEAKAAADKAAKEKAAADKAAADKAAKEKEKGADDTKRLGPPTNAANKELARQLAQSMFGWGEAEFACYDNIIMRESKWDQYADNPKSSAYGIPQALPGKKMASEGADWATNPTTQIRWGLKYVKARYGTPCQAWSFKRAKGWY